MGSFIKHTSGKPVLVWVLWKDTKYVVNDMIPEEKRELRLDILETFNFVVPSEWEETYDLLDPDK